MNTEVGSLKAAVFASRQDPMAKESPGVMGAEALP